MNARECAFVSLKRYANSQKYLNIEADATIRRAKLQDAERNLYTALFYGTVERQITLDYVIAQLCPNRPLENIDENVLLILRLSLYQLLYLDRVPAYAVLDQAACLTRRFAASAAVPFVNGVLRAATRMGKQISYPDRRQDFIGYLSVFYSVPRWLCEMWTDAYGKTKTERILSTMQTHAPVTLHCNTQKTTCDKVIATLKESGIDAHLVPFAPRAVQIGTDVSVQKLTGLQSGDYFVQDLSSQISMLLFDPHAGEKIMDACACPGGKSFAAAVQMQNQGVVDAFDLHENKLNLIRRTAEALGLSIITARTHNASVFDPELFEKYDRVLCDVPCSGLGVLAKKPEIRHKDPTSFARLPQIQSQILDNCSRYVKPGGLLQYSTCTLSVAENEEVVKRFLSAHDEFSPVPFSYGPVVGSEGMCTIFPDQFEQIRCDGFFVAQMRKKSSVSSAANADETDEHRSNS